MMPAYFANMAPVFVRKIFKRLAFPLDFEKTYNRKRIFGDHKTFRGVFFGLLAAIIIYAIQQYLYDISFFQSLSLIDYDKYAFFGFWMGVGVLSFDLIKSFFKRQYDIAPGKSWFPVDQLDYIIGALFFLSFYYFPGWLEIVLLIVISFILTLLVKHLGYYLKINKEKW